MTENFGVSFSKARNSFREKYSNWLWKT